MNKSAADDDRVHVVVRIRPAVRQDERYGDGSEALQVDKARNLIWLLTKAEGDPAKAKAQAKQYIFDKVLWKDSSQDEAWLATQHVVDGSLRGYAGCIMCYGQTGAGKTYTLGNEKKGSEGIMVRAFKHIFDHATADKEHRYQVSLSYVQIYLDELSDLLKPDKFVELREDPKAGVYVSGAEWLEVSSFAQALRVLVAGQRNRQTARTNLNELSSRSHSVLMLRIRRTGGVHNLDGVLYLVDLAGSERIKRSGVQGQSLEEAKSINQSLTTLGRCIEALASDNKRERPPFRESKLTRLLSPALGGAANTCLVVCVAPTMSDKFETVNSLEFGQQAMKVVVRAKVNATTDLASLTASLTAQRDAKLRPLRCLEIKVLKDLAPQLDEALQVEQEAIDAALEAEIIEEEVESQSAKLERLRAAAASMTDEKSDHLRSLEAERSRLLAELHVCLAGLKSPPKELDLAYTGSQIQRELLSRKLEHTEAEARAAEIEAAHVAYRLDSALRGAVDTARSLQRAAAQYARSNNSDISFKFEGHARALWAMVLEDSDPVDDQRLPNSTLIQSSSNDGDTNIIDSSQALDGILPEKSGASNKPRNGSGSPLRHGAKRSSFSSGVDDALMCNDMAVFKAVIDLALLASPKRTSISSRPTSSQASLRPGTCRGGGNRSAALQEVTSSPNT